MPIKGVMGFYEDSSLTYIYRLSLSRPYGIITIIHTHKRNKVVYLDSWMLSPFCYRQVVTPF